MHPCTTWDFTLPAGDRTPQEVIKVLQQLFKKWTFQKEQGDATGYVHYQGRGSLHKKRRLDECKKLFCALDFKDIHLSPSSNNSLGACFYVVKVDTRIEGPWTDKDDDEVVYIPRQYRGMETSLKEWQKRVWDSADEFDPRSINVIYDPVGGNGKSTVASLMDLHKRGIDLPPMNDAEKLIQSVADILIARECREPKTMFIDIPRAMDKRKLGGLYTAIEQIKKGKVYDTRYQYKEWWFDSPQIWVFTNIEPDLSLLSRDRWNVYEIRDSHLIPYHPPTFQSDQFVD